MPTSVKIEFYFHSFWSIVVSLTKNQNNMAKVRIKVTVIRTSTAILLSLFMKVMACGQSVFASYPDQHVIISLKGGDVVSESRKNTTKMAEIISEQHTTDQMLTVLDKWNKEYNDYLKDTTGIVSSIKAGSMLYTQGAILLENIFLLKKAIGSNPEGLPASVPMNNLYMETAVTAIKCCKTLKAACTKGGSDNMLTGAERVELLWRLGEEMRELNKKVRKTAISIAYYRLTDVWWKATEGMVDYDHGVIARRCMNEWSRAVGVSHTLSE